MGVSYVATRWNCALTSDGQGKNTPDELHVGRSGSVKKCAVVGGDSRTRRDGGSWCLMLAAGRARSRSQLGILRAVTLLPFHVRRASWRRLRRPSRATLINAQLNHQPCLITLYRYMTTWNGKGVGQ
jgi:hypothetical protein